MTTIGQAPAVDQPKHKLSQLTTYELRDYRRELEHAVTYYTKHHPAAPARADLQSKLDEVLAEQEDRARIAANA